MKHILFTFFLLTGLTVIITASPQVEYKTNHLEQTMSNKQIKKMDASLTKRKAIHRNFKTKKEFDHKIKRTAPHKQDKYKRYTKNRYNNGSHYNSDNYRSNYRPLRQLGYRYPNRGWLLAYQYDRASFYDQDGFFYGFFNRHGYYFENVFYRYDRFYTYRDRVRGRGLFNRRYHMPENAEYYGFCSKNNHPREYARVY